jgi:glucans biosynthesis protein C
MTEDKSRSSPDIRSRVVPTLDTVRGLTCLMVVALHVVGDTESNGLRLPMTSGWHYAMESIEFLRIPMFTALSGYLYGGRRVVRPELGDFWLKKLRRLGIPLAFVTFVIWWLRFYSPNQEPNTSLLHDLFFDASHLWYLQALLVLFTVISIADAFWRPGSVALALTGLLMIMIAQAGVEVTSFMGIAGSIYLAPYFLFGIILRANPEWLQDRRAGILALGIMIIVLGTQQFGLNHIIDRITIMDLPAAMAGMAGVVFFLQRFPKNQLLARIGFYSYTIYLWHVIANAAARAVLIKLQITDIPTLFVAGLTAGVIVPIVMYHVARRIPLVSWAVTGERRILGNAPVGPRRRVA